MFFIPKPDIQLNSGSFVNKKSLSGQGRTIFDRERNMRMILTSKEIYHEPAGERLDEWVGRNVMAVPHLYGYQLTEEGQIRVFESAPDPESGVSLRDKILAEDLPPYSTDIATAWEVVEELSSRGWPFSIEVDQQGCIRAGIYTKEQRIRFTDGESFATAPEAICKAALLLSLAMEEAHSSEPG
jgi:hypothetical protein